MKPSSIWKSFVPGLNHRSRNTNPIAAIWRSHMNILEQPISGKATRSKPDRTMNKRSVPIRNPSTRSINAFHRVALQMTWPYKKTSLTKTVNQILKKFSKYIMSSRQITNENIYLSPPYDFDLANLTSHDRLHYTRCNPITIYSTH